MGTVEPTIKKLKDLRKGDVIRMRIPFEENTPDYYNGYKPKDIRGHLVKDDKGRPSKPRFVIVVGRDESNIMYLPMTSRHSGFDSERQYPLEDNSMTWKKDPDMTSWVEVNSLRAVYANDEWDIHHFGRISDNDMANIMVRVAKREINFESKRDQRAYVSRNKEGLFEQTLKEHGYKLTREDFNGKVYDNEDGKTVTRTKWGLVHYHVQLTMDEVKDMVKAREGARYNFRAIRRNPIAQNIKSDNEAFNKYKGKINYKEDDEFARAVTNLTENRANKESGVAL